MTIMSYFLSIQKNTFMITTLVVQTRARFNMIELKWKFVFIGTQ